ncbi:hypothetical protein MKEN_00992200 [Mycena kentingensis (nom. inval.)]|nr:hypothetical protein MKEN_00992200 [Mycena kentingensis (nom. inval.)]
MPKSSSTRARAKYALQACDICRVKRIKCDGKRDICGPCKASNREAECAWTKETVRKPRTEAHFEALRKHSDAQDAYIRVLEQRLAGCSCRDTKRSSANTLSRPQAMDEDEDDSDDVPEGAASDELDIAQELCVPTEKLKLEDRDLMFHGITTPFRFATPSSPSPRSTSLPPTQLGTYILQLDGVDASLIDDSFPWNRHLPAGILFDRREHDKILDLVFKFFTSWCMRIVPALFLRDMYRYLTSDPSDSIKTAHYSPMLHNALLALGCAYSDDPRVRDITARRAIAAHAKSFIEAEVARPDISVVHALAMTGSFHSCAGEQMLGWMYFGMSARVSHALGLCVNTAPWVRSGRISHEDMVDRNWAYWSTFTLDVCWSLYVGRELCGAAPPSRNHLRFFEDDRERVLYEEYDEIPFSYACPPGGTPTAPQPNHLSRTSAATWDLLLIASKIMGVVNDLGRAVRRREVTDRVITDIDLQLHSWKSSLAPEIDLTPTMSSRESATPHRLMVHAAYWWCFILLHRPFFHRKTRPAHGSDPEVDHVKLCKRAAENIMTILATWRRLYGLRLSQVTLAQVVFSAGTIFLLLAASSTSPSRARVAQTTLRAALTEAELCVQYLTEIGESWGSGMMMAGILRNLLMEQVRPLVERKSGRSAVQAFGVAGPSTNPQPPAVATGPGPTFGAETASSSPAISELDIDQFDFDPSLLDGSFLPGLPATFDPKGAFGYPDADAASQPMPDFLGLSAMLGTEPFSDAPYIAPFMGDIDMDLDRACQWDWSTFVGRTSGLGLQTSAFSSDGHAGNSSPEMVWHNYLQ